MKKEVMTLGPLAAKIGESTRQIQRIVDEGYVPRPEVKGQYDVWLVVRGMVKYYKDKTSSASESRTIDAARAAKANADMAEMQQGKMKGTLCSRDEYRNNYADAIAQGVRNLSRLGLKKDVLEKVLAAIRDVKLPEPAEEK